MKKSVILIFFITITGLSSFAQKKEETNYADPFQVDSSEYFLIPKLVDNDDKEAYGKGKGYMPWGSYGDIYFYNTRTNQTKKLFGPNLALILPFNQRSYYNAKPEETPPNFLPKHIVYLVRTDNYNGDNGLDTDDPVYIYISSKNGEQLTQITPKGLHVLSWVVSKDKKTILVKLKQDKDGNKKFGDGDDDVYYRIDLDDDVAKIKCYPISL